MSSAASMSRRAQGEILVTCNSLGNSLILKSIEYIGIEKDEKQKPGSVQLLFIYIAQPKILISRGFLSCCATGNLLTAQMIAFPYP